MTVENNKGYIEKKEDLREPISSRHKVHEPMSHFASRNDTGHVSPTIFFADHVTHRWCFQELSRYRSTFKFLFSLLFSCFSSFFSFFFFHDCDNPENHLFSVLMLLFFFIITSIGERRLV